MKKFILILLSIVITICMVACSPDEIAEQADHAASKLEKDIFNTASDIASKMNGSEAEEAPTEITTAENTVAPDTEATANSNAEPTTISTTAAVDELVNGMHLDFKEAMDSYEEFIDEYVEFMTKYSESDDITSMLVDYGKFMVKYAEATEDFENWEDGDLNNTEMQYYIAVQSRVSQKLLAVAAAMAG